MSEQKEITIKHGPITTVKITRNVWVAKCSGTEPFNFELTMRGTSEQDAIDKLKKFLDE